MQGAASFANLPVPRMLAPRGASARPFATRRRDMAATRPSETDKAFPWAMRSAPLLRSIAQRAGSVPSDCHGAVLAAVVAVHPHIQPNHLLRVCGCVRSGRDQSRHGANRPSETSKAFSWATCNAPLLRSIAQRAGFLPLDCHGAVLAAVVLLTHTSNQTICFALVATVGLAETRPDKAVF